MSTRDRSAQGGNCEVPEGPKVSEDAGKKSGGKDTSSACAQTYTKGKDDNIVIPRLSGRPDPQSRERPGAWSLALSTVHIPFMTNSPAAAL